MLFHSIFPLYHQFMTLRGYFVIYIHVALYFNGRMNADVLLIQNFVCTFFQFDFNALTSMQLNTPATPTEIVDLLIMISDVFFGRKLSMVIYLRYGDIQIYAHVWKKYLAEGNINCVTFILILLLSEFYIQICLILKLYT